MAGDHDQKSEKPTPKRLREARRKGQVARSQDIGGWMSLLVFAALVPSLGERAVHQVTGFLQGAIAALPSAAPQTDAALLGRGLFVVAEAAGPVVGVVGLVAIASSFAQVGLRFAPGALGFKMSKINPLAGIKRIFSAQGGWELMKSVLRLALLGGVGYVSAHHLFGALMGSGTLPLSTTLGIAGGTLVGVARYVGAAALLLGLGDYAFQRHRLGHSLKMTKHEVRQENKEAEGSPEIRREIRRRRRRMSRMQIMAAVAGATVVVVNPTHVAVALAYDRDNDRAPRLVAKGDDHVALAIRLEAIKRGIPVVENPPLARAISAACDVNEEVPARLYEVVAKLLAFVYRLTPAARALVEVHHLAS
ncbi:MAG: type secretion exporter [Acidimicrobiaceae bacterium]|nr:type secretion exporter [Acidimicrobiaceae bacterium]